MAKTDDGWDTTPGRTGRRTISQIMEPSNKKNSNEGSGDSSGDGSSKKSSSKNKKSSKKSKVNKTKSYKESALVVPPYRYGMPNELSLGRAGLEIYETDEENYVPFVPTGSVDGVGATTVEDDSIDSDNDEGDLPGFSLHFGDVKVTHYATELESISFESDYKDMNDNGTVKLDSINLKKAYKGVRVKLLAEWDDYEDSVFKWEYLQEALEGFITEQTFTDNSVEVTINGMTKPLDIKYKFDFKQMYRSEIINQVIKTAGLKPVLNFKGLEDDITDFKNYSESDSSSGDGTNVEIKSTGSSVIDDVIKKAVSGVTGDLEKAKAVDKAFKNHTYYSFYYDSEYGKNIEKAWKDAHLNCADGANVLCAMFLALGFNSVILYVPPGGPSQYGHYIVKVDISGKTYYTDCAAGNGAKLTREFGHVWNERTNGSSRGTVV